MHKLLLPTILIITILILSSCGAAIQISRVGKTYPSLSSEEDVRVFNQGEMEYINAQKIGKIFIGDTGFTIGQSYEVAVKRAVEQCRILGGNAMEINEVISPSLRSTSYQIYATAYRINSKRIVSRIEKTGLTKEFLIKDWDENGLISPIEGIYERIVGNESIARYQLALKKINNAEYNIIYLSGVDSDISIKDVGDWKEGDLKAIMSKTATSNLYKLEWYMLDKTQNMGAYATFDSGKMNVIINGEEDVYLKLYPYSEDGSYGENSITLPNTGEKWTGTGFAINSDGYIATNYHVANGANHIYVYGVNGDFTTGYTATVVASDIRNDLAIIKIEDTAVSKIGIPPYRLLFKSSDVGSNVIAMGYPLTTTMGEELKVTDGIISSQTGFKGDVTTYQVSVPVQPGNSGGPLLDANGNVIGIISSRHKETDNVSYAIKVSYLYNLIMASNINIELGNTNTLKGLLLTKQISKIRPFVFLLKCE